jgi:glycosyltransferase involved in cell wall biosynthesis
VLTVHGVASRWISTARTSSQDRAWRFRVDRAIRSTRKLITVSNSSADDIAEVFDVERSTIKVIPHGIDQKRFAIPQDLSPRIGSLVPREFALYVGNLEPRKNLVELIGAFERSEVKTLGVPLIIAGRPAWNYEPILEAIANATNTVYLGFVTDDERASLMQRCSCFVFPSLYEGFGFPILEAMAAGSPVLSSNRGSLREVAGPARIVQDLSAVGIAEAIADSLADSAWRSSAPQAGREWSNGFSWSESARKHIEVYRGSLA